jgi:hypothetical protein
MAISTFETLPLLGNGRTTSLPSLAQASPVVAKALMLPGEDRAGLDQGEYFWPAGPPGATGEKFTVSQNSNKDVSHEQRPLYMYKQRVV